MRWGKNMLNENIKNLRLAKNMSQVELAKSLGVSKQSVSNWENDNIQPSIEMLVKIAKCLNVSTDYLLGICSEKVIDATGLTDEQIAHINQIIKDIRSTSDF